MQRLPFPWAGRSLAAAADTAAERQGTAERPQADLKRRRERRDRQVTQAGAFRGRRGAVRSFFRTHAPIIRMPPGTAPYWPCASLCVRKSQLERSASLPKPSEPTSRRHRHPRDKCDNQAVWKAARLAGKMKCSNPHLLGITWLRWVSAHRGEARRGPGHQNWRTELQR